MAYPYHLKDHRFIHRRSTERQPTLRPRAPRIAEHTQKGKAFDIGAMVCYRHCVPRTQSTGVHSRMLPSSTREWLVPITLFVAIAGTCFVYFGPIIFSPLMTFGLVSGLLCTVIVVGALN